MLSEEWNIRKAPDDRRLLVELGETSLAGNHAISSHCGNIPPVVIWGAALPTDEYFRTGLRVWGLSFDCIDFGGNLKLSTVVKQKLRVGEDVGTKKCAILALAAGVEWASQGQPKLCPSRRRIDV